MIQVQKKYKYPVISTDVVIFTVHEEQLQVLLIKMKKDPFKGRWAAPGGLVKVDESVDAGAVRILTEKAGLPDVHLEQLYTFGGVNRDPFGRVVSVAYFALIPSNQINLKTTSEYEDITWFPISKLPKLAYDHSEIFKVAISRLRSKLEYTNIVYSLLPKEFTLTDLQEIYEIILGRELDKRNFRKKILSLDILKKHNKKKVGNAHRPAQLFSFTQRTPKEIQLI